MEQKPKSTKLINHIETKPKRCKGLNVLADLRTDGAFTLAEVLITLAIIGVVAVLTVPALIQNYNEKAWETAKSVFEKRLEVAVKQLNTEEKLAGYSSTMDFVNELKNKIKIINVCDSNNLGKCFERTILTADGQEVNAANLRTSAELAKENWGTETVGVQFANGVNALIAYNPNTDQQPFNNQFSATEASIAILYDISGYKNPNTLGKDVNQNANVKTLGCMIEPDLLGGTCITKILRPDAGYSPMTYAECTEAKDKGEIDVQYCYYGDDYFAGAVKACGGKSKMPTQDQLTQIANYIYNTDVVSSSGTTNNLAIDTEKASQFLSASPFSNYFYAWSGQETSQVEAYYRKFDSTYTNWNDSRRSYGASTIVVCVD